MPKQYSASQKTIRISVIMAFLFLVNFSAFGQLTGVKTIGGVAPDYATFTLAITDLNTVGVGTGGVIFNVAAGEIFNENPPEITATGTVSNPIVFQKNGAGANPVIKPAAAGTLTTTTLGANADGIVVINGGDYITFDGINLDGNDTFASLIEKFEYGYYLKKASGTDASKNVTIKNSTITMYHTTGTLVVIGSGIFVSNISGTTTATVTSTDGRSENIKISGNTVTGAYNPIQLRGFAAASPYDFYDQNNEVGVEAGNTVTLAGGSTTAYGIYGIYQNNIKINNNIVNGGGTAIVYGILNTTATSANGEINGNSVTLTFTGTTQTVYGISNGAGSTPLGNTISMNNNTVTNCLFTSATSGAFYGLHNSGAPATINMSGNTITNNILAGTGNFYGLFSGAAGTSPVNVTNNTISGNQKTGASGTFFCVSLSTGLINFNTNLLFNNSIPTNSGTSSSTLYGYYNLGSPTVETIYNNQIYNLSIGGATTATSCAIYGFHSNTTSSAVKNIYGNTIYGLNLANSSTGGGTVYGLSNALGADVRIYKNSLYNLSAAGTGGTVHGYYVSSGTVALYNNFVSDLRAPFSTNMIAVNGIYILGGTTVGAYYNTVYLNAVSASATTFGTSGIYVSSTPTVELKNNLIINNSVPGPTGGLTVAHRRTTTTIGTYASSSNNNDFYAGTPGASNVIFFDGTNADITLNEYKSRVNPADASSVTENPPFMNVTTAPYNLHINTTIPTQVESGGIPVSSPFAITDDFDGDTRNAVNPDMGADEFAGISADFTAPIISYIPLLNATTTSPRTLTATITDVAGVPTAGIGLPMLYWNVNGGTYAGVQGVYVSGDNYSFTFGGGAINDVISYYVVAQDVNNNVGAFPSAGAGGFTANPPAAATPPTNPSSYIIADAALKGDYTVGLALFNKVTGKDIYFERSVSRVMKEVIVEVPADIVPADKNNPVENIPAEASHHAPGIKQLMEVEEISWIAMEKGQRYTGELYVKKAEDPNLEYPESVDGIYATITAAVNDLNIRGVDSTTRFLFTDAEYPTENFPITVKIQNTSLPTAVNTVTFKPAAGVNTVISGPAPAGQIFKILNSYVSIDGNNAATTTRNLTLENTSTTSPQVILLGSTGTTPVVGNTIKNTIIINGANTSSALVVSDGTAAGTAGYFNDITIQNNSIQKAYIANYNIAVIAAGNGSGLNITQNIFTAEGANSVRLVAVYAQGIDGASVTNNTMANFSNSASEFNRAVWFATGTINSIIKSNNVSNFSQTSTGGAPIAISVSSAVADANIVIEDNIIRGLITSGSGTVSGIYVFSTTSGVLVQRNSIGNIRNTHTTGWGSNGIYLASTLNPANITVVNNTVWDVASYGYTSAGVGDNGYALIIVSGAGYKIYYNSFHLNTNQTSATSLTAVINITSGVTATGAIDLRNNVFATTQTVGANQYAIYSGAPATVFSFIDYNDYFTLGPNLGYLTTPRADLAAWRLASLQDLNSISANPMFLDPDLLRPTIGSPLLLAGTPIAGITTDFLGTTRHATTPTIGAYEEGVLSRMAGTYTIGLAAFRNATGKDVYFETRTRTIMRNLNGYDSEVDLNVSDKNETIINNDPVWVEVTEEYVELMENGQPFNFGFFKTEESRGVYPTISAAVTDVVARGISAPVVFSLVDANYPSETYPIDFGPVFGTSAANTITIKPAPGIQTVIPGSTTQAAATFRIGGASYIIVDGSNTVGGTTKDLTIIGLAAGTIPSVHLYAAASNNVIKNVIIESQNNNTGSGTLLFGSGPFAANDNLIENCVIKNIDTAAVRAAVGVYFLSSHTGSGAQIKNCDIYNFTDRGISLGGAPAPNILLSGNMIHQPLISAKTTIYGVYIGRNPGLIIEKNYINNLKSSGASPTIAGIYYFGSSGNAQDVRIENNVISISAENNQTAGTLRGIDYFGYTANSIELYYNTVYIGGTGVTGGTTQGIAKRDAATTFKALDNVVYNQRSNGSGTGKHYAVYASNTIATTFELNNNDYYANGTGGVLGYFGSADVTTIEAWRTATGQEVNSFSADPVFASNATDYRPQIGSPLIGAGAPVAGITTDILGVTRNTTTPTVGAYEEGVIAAILAPQITSAIADTFWCSLNWTDNSNNETGFRIERRLDTLSTNPWTEVGSVLANVTAFIDSGLSPNTRYSYRMYAYNAGGNSPYSNIVVITTIVPVELTSFTATQSGTDVIVSWTTATELNNRGFEVERKIKSEWEKLTFIEGKGTTTEEQTYSFSDGFKYQAVEGTISYRLRQIDFDGRYHYSGTIEVEVDFSPKEYTLFQNYPNPFNPSTTIKYALPFASNVKVSVYNMLGESIGEILNVVQDAGYYDVTWNASNKASGIYFYTIEAKSVDGKNTFNSVKKMMLVK